MNWLKYVEVPVSRLVLPGDIKARQRAPHVKELADSYDATGGEPGNAPWVEAKTWRVVAGRDRIAAAMVKGLKKVWVRLGVFTERELLRAEIVENLHRRHDDRNALIARLVDATAQDVKGAPMGRLGQTERAEVRGSVSSATGLTRQAVRRAEQKAHDSEKRAATSAPESVAPSGEAAGTPAAVASRKGAAVGALGPVIDTPPPPIETYGLPLTDLVRGQVVEAIEVLSLIDAGLRRSQAALTSIDGALERLAGLALDGKATRLIASEVTRLREQLHSLAGRVRGEVPVAICPYDKGLQRVADQDCAFCGGFGVATRAQMEGASIPSELVLTGETAKVTNGRGGFVTYAKAQNGEYDGGRPRKAVKIDMPDGSRYEGDAYDEDEEAGPMSAAAASVISSSAEQVLDDIEAEIDGTMPTDEMALLSKDDVAREYEALLDKIGDLIKRHRLLNLGAR